MTAANGNTLYVAAEAQGLLILDVTTPSNPQLLGTITDGPAYGVTYAGTNKIFVANWGNGVSAYDVTNPASPVDFGTVNSPGNSYEPIAWDENTLVVADYCRLVLVPMSLDEEAPATTVQSPDEVLIAWPGGTGATAAGMPGKAEFAPDGSPWQSTGALRDPGTGAYRVRLTGLLPLHRYSFKVTPVPGTIPPDTGFSRDYRFATPPADPSAMAVTRRFLRCRPSCKSCPHPHRRAYHPGFP